MFFYRKEMLSPVFGKTDHISPLNFFRRILSRKPVSGPAKGEKGSAVRKMELKKALLLTSPQKRPFCLRGSLTAEAAVAAPVFAACMAAVLSFVNVYGAACTYSSILTQTGEELAIGAYASEYVSSGSPLPVTLSIGYAAARVHAGSADTSCVRGENLLLSSILDSDQMIDLVLTYQVQSPSGLVKIPWIFFVQRACVRGWVGREGSGQGEGDGDSDDPNEQTVYVTEHGSVYHTDPNCTHIRLSIEQVSEEEAHARRNRYGEKYHACERCGGGSGQVYITSDGNRYHSSLECSGLKRTVREMTRGETDGLRPCSKCAAHQHIHGDEH